MRNHSKLTEMWKVVILLTLFVTTLALQDFSFDDFDDTIIADDLSGDEIIQQVQVLALEFERLAIEFDKELQVERDRLEVERVEQFYSDFVHAMSRYQAQQRAQEQDVS